MSNEKYTFAREQFLKGQLDWINDTFKVLLVDTANYSFAKDSDRTLADVPVSARIATSSALSGKTATDGVARASNVTVNSVAGPAIGAITIFHATGTDSTSELVCYLDTGIGLPWNPQGGNVVIHWDTGPSGIFVI